MIVEFRGDLFQLFLRGWRFYPEHISPCISVAPRPLNGGVDTLDGQSIGASDENEVGIAPRGNRGTEFGHHFARGNYRLAAHVAASFGIHLVFQMNGRDAGLLVFMDS